MDRRSFLHASLCVVATKSGRIFEPGSQSDALNSAIREDPQLPTDPAFVKAMQAVQNAIPGAEADPDRPVYHFRPPANWTNDPNGPFYFQGWHHLFYQFNPFGVQLAHQHWGHARSRDLVNWEHLPIAIWPSAELGETAIFSGGAAFTADGRPRLIYTSIGNRQPEQWLVLPKDEELFLWEKYAKNPVLSQAAHIGGPISQWRDPFMFRHDNSTYMVCGGAGANGRAQVQLYRSESGDLTQWKHLGPIFQSMDRETRNFECPNLFPLDDKWVMIVSPNRACEYWIGDLDIAAMKFLPTAHGIVDPGDAYASNISIDSKGRTILWLWGRTAALSPGLPVTPNEKAWSGVITMPRILSIGPDGYLLERPIPEFETLRGSVLEFPGQSLEKPSVIDGAATDCAEIEAVFAGSGTFGLELRRSAGGKPGVVVSIQAGFQGTYLNVGNVRAYVGPAEKYKLHVFLDKRCIEVFANDGLAAVYKWVDVPAPDTGIAVFGQAAPLPKFPGGKPPAGMPDFAAPQPPRLESLKLWPMRGSAFSLDHFHV